MTQDNALQMYRLDRSHHAITEVEDTACFHKRHVFADTAGPCVCGKTFWKQCDCGQPAYRIKDAYPVCRRCDQLEELGYE